MNASHVETKLEVIVRYPAATKPFVEPNADPHETIGALKTRVLQAFGLTEVHDSNQSTVYFLYHGDAKLEDLSRTLGQIAGDDHVLRMKLVQQIVQGDRGAASIDELCFAADLEEVLNADDSKRWEIKQTAKLGCEVFMRAAREPSERYLARLLWDRYTANPPSLKFLDPDNSSESNPRSWPQCLGFRPTSVDACVSWTREGHAQHPEWANASTTRWDSNGNALYRALNCLQDTLDYHYQGRFSG